MSDDRIVEASGELLDLLQSAERGDAVVITRGGEPAARLVPERRRPAPGQVEEALRLIDEFRRRPGLPRFDWEEWKAYRDEGRR